RHSFIQRDVRAAPALVAVEKRQEAIEPDQDATGEDGETDQQAKETRHPGSNGFSHQLSISRVRTPDTRATSRAQLSPAVAVPTIDDSYAGASTEAGARCCSPRALALRRP